MPAQSGAGADFGFAAAQKIKSVTLIEADGKIFTGAAAVFRLMKKHEGHVGAILCSLYERVKPIQWLADWIYRFIARYRLLISRILKLNK